MRPLKTRRLLGSSLLSALVLAARFFAIPPLRDAATGAFLPGARLDFSWVHVALTPLSSLADQASCQSVRQDFAFLALLLIVGFGWFRFFVYEPELSGWFKAVRGLRALGVWMLLVVAFCAWTVVGPRPSARLVLDDAAVLPVDFHSHTSFSWDGRRWFTPAQNIAWHTAAGFGAFFVTDHNVFEGARQAHAQSILARQAGREQAEALLGEELSLSGAHVVVLGNRSLVDADRYNDGDPGLLRFLGAHPGMLAIMSLPEYAEHHWPQLDQIPGWGADGFELLAGSPKGLELTQARLDRVVSLCRARGLLMTGATDNHGWGGAPCVWNLVRLPGWRSLDPDALQDALLRRLRAGGAGAVQVAERSMRVQPSPGMAVWLDPVRASWRTARAWTWPQAAAALVWIWVFPMAFSRLRL